jgi:alkylhydroperoxidase family enzyme
MTRIEPVAPPYTGTVAEDLARLMPPGMEPLALFRTVARNPRVLSRMRRGGLLDPGSIGVRDRELVILRTTARCGAEYEWGVHVAFFARAAGLDEAQVAATRHGAAGDAVWTPRDAALIAACDALHERADLPHDVWAQLRAAYDDAQIVEIIALAGLYHFVSFMTNALRLPLEPGAARW